MYNGIGLQTPRGSGTNGHVQTNKFFVRPKTGKLTDNTRGFEAGQGTAGISKQPNKDILNHDCKRRLELKLAILEDKLLDQGYTDAEIAQKIEDARKTLQAAVASEEAGGPTAMVVSDNKFSDTQTHQIAARKEKQMKVLRSALGISSVSEVNEHEVEGNEDEEGKRKNMQMSDSDDDERPEHSFLDRDFKPKKRVIEDLKTVEDKKKGVKESRNKKGEGEQESCDLLGHQRKEAQRERELGDDPSDTHSSGKDAKRGQKKRRTIESDDPGSDVEHKKRREYDSDDSYTESSDDDAVRSSKRGVKKYKKSHERYDSDDDSEDDLGRNRSKKEVEKYRKSDRSHDGKRGSKRDIEKYKKSHKRHDIDDESGSEKDV